MIFKESVNCIHNFCWIIFFCQVQVSNIHFLFHCILCLLSKCIWEPCQILLKHHAPLDAPAEPSPFSKWAVYSSVQHEMQANTNSGVMYFDIWKDLEARSTLPISRWCLVGACAGAATPSRLPSRVHCLTSTRFAGFVSLSPSIDDFCHTGHSWACSEPQISA